MFADGSGNVYRFAGRGGNALKFVYDPVRPITSSSGHYSGGEKRAGVLSLTHATRVWKRARGLRDDATLQLATRPKGSGHFRMTWGDHSAEFTVRSGPELKAFEAAAARASGRASGTAEP